MVVAVIAMNVAVVDFFCGGRAHFGYLSFEMQFHTGQRMVAVYYGFAIGNIGYSVPP